jgi:hypothetical protein
MRRISRQILIGALVVIFLNSACGAVLRQEPTPVWTVSPGAQTLLPTATILSPATATATATSSTPQIPITGENVVSMQCQFCVDAETHAILMFPDFAYFDVSSDSPVGCLTADTYNGKRILICHGPQSTSFNLNICSDPSNCLQFPVALQPCPLLQVGATPGTTTPSAPVFLTPINTLKAPTKKPTETRVGPSLTPIPGGGSATSTPAPPTLVPATLTTPPPTSYQ